MFRKDRLDLLGIAIAAAVVCAMCPATITLMRSASQLWLHGLPFPGSSLLIGLRPMIGNKWIAISLFLGVALPLALKPLWQALEASEFFTTGGGHSSYLCSSSVGGNRLSRNPVGRALGCTRSERRLANGGWPVIGPAWAPFTFSIASLRAYCSVLSGRALALGCRRS